MKGSDWEERLQNAQAMIPAAMEYRRNIVHAAAAARVPPSKIAEALGVSRQRVNQIMRETRDTKC